MDFWNRCTLRTLIMCVPLSLFSPVTMASSAASLPEFKNVVYTDPQQVTQVGEVTFSECRVSPPGRAHFRFLECGSLQVPENYNTPDGRKITLFIGRLKAVGKKPHEDPFVPISGGPGSAASEGYLFPGQGFDKIIQNRDIYIIDQRGTGKSAKLVCLEDLEEDIPFGYQSSEKTRQLMSQCLNELEGDPAQYTTSVAVRDLEAVRQALGVKTWNLYGASYGTRVAQHYLRQYPQATRTVILDAVAHPQLNLGYEIAIHSQRALEGMLARCKAQEACHTAFPELEKGLSVLFERLEKAPLELQVENFSTGKPEAFTLYKNHLMVLVRMSLYTPEVTALLPLLLHEAHTGNYAPLARSAIKVGNQMSSMLSIPMHNSVVCSEDMAFFNMGEGKRALLANTYIGEQLIDTMLDTCAIWPIGPVDAAFKAPVESDKPVLLLSGTADPITPPAYADKAAEKLTNSRHLVAEGMGHGLAAKGCVPVLMAKFLDAASAENLDAECLTRLEADPFFIDFNGPMP